MAYQTYGNMASCVDSTIFLPETPKTPSYGKYKYPYTTYIHPGSKKCIKTSVEKEGCSLN